MKTAMHATELDRTKTQKLYSQLLEVLREQLGKGCWSVGTQIPTEEQLCSRYNVSKATVRLALAELVSLGYLKRLQGKGTFVRRTKPDNRITMLIHLDDADLYENSTISRVIEQKTCRPSKATGDNLHLADGDHCYFLSRLIIANGSPFCIQKVYVPYSLLPDAIPAEAIRSVSPYCFLETFCGTKIKRIKEISDVAPAAKEDADLLELIPGTSVLRQHHICYANGDVPMSSSETLFRTDAQARAVEFERLRF
jgi:GntR family frlABCD operon transcriptional regulator